MIEKKIFIIILILIAYALIVPMLIDSASVALPAWIMAYQWYFFIIFAAILLFVSIQLF